MEDKNQQSIQQRIETLIQVFAKGNKSAFGRRADIQSGVLAGLVGGRMNNPSFNVLQKILLAYPQIQEEWFLLGKGPMLKPELDPGVLFMKLEHARSLLRTAYVFSESREVRLALHTLKTALNQLRALEPAFEAVEQGIYADRDKADVQDYHQVVSSLSTQLNVLEEQEFTFIEEGQHEPSIPLVPIISLPPLPDFIEVTNEKGHRILIARKAISHIYDTGIPGKATVELLTVGEKSNKIVNTLQSYESIKGLMGSNYLT